MLVRFWRWLTDESPSQCSSCILLRDMLEAERDAKDRILRQLLQITAPTKPEVHEVPEVPMDLGRKAIPWSLRKKLLEEADRDAARIRKEQAKVQEAIQKPSPATMSEIQELEHQLGVE